MEILIDHIVTMWSRWIWPLGQFIIGLSLVVFVHELGHFLAAKWAGIKVLKFSLGMGPQLWGIERGGTQYRIGAIFIGGYVQMLGQDDFKPAKGEDGEEAESGSWQAAPAGKRLVVLAAGVAMNVIFSALVFLMVYLIGIEFIAPLILGRWASVKDKVIAILTDGIERRDLGAVKAEIKSMAASENPLVQMALQTAAALADPKPEKKPVSLGKRVGAAILGRVLTGLLFKR
ncbi:hypothetical protein LCGC14_2308990 [marine sediment metagenome]|uniref:Peptidase M50 domain-containing protein n=1 Tax=marine sediment metagenome TaxID=412755 RepID=A0A0F9CLP4_9ZZZZ